MREPRTTTEGLTDALYAGVHSRAALADALGGIQTHLDCATFTAAEVDHGRPEGPVLDVLSNLPSDLLDRYPDCAHLDPVPRAFLSVEVGSASSTDRIIPADELRRCVFLHEFLRPAGLDQALVSPIAVRGSRTVLLSLVKSVTRRSFSDADFACVEHLAPHIARALVLRRSFAAADDDISRLEDLLDRRETALLVWHPDGRALFLNRAARALAAAGDGIAFDREGRLLLADRGARARVARLHEDVRRGGAGGFTRAARPSGHRAYILSVGRHPFPRSGAGYETLVAIHDPAHRAAPTPRAIADVLGVSLGSASVIAALVTGESLGDFAARSGLTMHTVRFHLKNAFARTETHSQAALVQATLSALHALAPETLRPPE